LYIAREKKELIIVACLYPKFKLNWLTENKKNIAASYLEDLLRIKPSKTLQMVSNKLLILMIFHTKIHSKEELQEFFKSNNNR